MHPASDLEEPVLNGPPVRMIGEPAVEAIEILHPVRALRRLQLHFLIEERVRDGDLVFIQKVGQPAMAFRGVADDHRRLAVARTVAELLQRGVDAVVLRRIDAMDFPVE